MLCSTPGASKIILTGHDSGQKLRAVHKEELTMSNSERSVRKRIEENAQSANTKRKSKSPQTTPTSKSPPYTKTSPPSAISKPPPSKATSKSSPSSTSKPPPSKEKRIRVTTSDGRTCNLKLDLAVTFVQLQEAIEQELK
jgi:deubiquitinating protein VCIP135